MLVVYVIDVISKSLMSSLKFKGSSLVSVLSLMFCKCVVA